VRDQAGAAGFIEEALQHLGMARQIGLEHLERDALADLLVDGLVDLRHPPFTQQAPHAVGADGLADLERPGRKRKRHVWRRPS
jgi:hypothetical protein